MKKSLLFISALIAGATGFAQSIPNGNFETWTGDTATNWSSNVGFAFVFNGNALASGNPLATTQSTSAVSGGKSLVIHSVAAASGAYLPGVSISGSNAYLKITQQLVAAPGQTPPYAPSGTPTQVSYGSFPATTVPKTLSGFARYRTKAGSANQGSILVLVFGNSGDTVGRYTPNQGLFFIDSVAKDAGFVNFNIPITATQSTCDSIKIVLTTNNATGTPDVADTLWIDRLRFFSCTVDPAVTLNAPSITSDDGASGLSMEGTGTLTATTSAAYNHTFTFAVPDPSIGLITHPLAGQVNYTLTPLDSVVFGDVTTITGLTFTQGAPGGVAYPNSKYCYSISGNIPATDNILYEMKIVQTPYGSAIINALGTDYNTTVPNATVANIPYNLSNMPVDSVTIKVGNPVGIADFDVSVGFNVSQNSPNPFDNSTTINFNCAVSGNATFVVTDVLGRQVYDTNINATAGSNTFTYSTDLANGTYFFSLSDGTNTITRTMVVSQ